MSCKAAEYGNDTRDCYDMLPHPVIVVTSPTDEFGPKRAATIPGVCNKPDEDPQANMPERNSRSDLFSKRYLRVSSTSVQSTGISAKS